MLLRKTLFVLAAIAFATGQVSTSASAITLTPDQLNILKGKRSQVEAESKVLSETNKKIAVNQAEINSARDAVKHKEKDSATARSKLEKMQAYDRDNPGVLPSDTLRAAEADNRLASHALSVANDKLADAEAKGNELNSTAALQDAELQQSKSSFDETMDGVVDQQLREQLRAIQVSKEVTAVGRVSCGEDPIPVCKERSKKAAELNASEQGSVVVVNSITEIKNFKLTKEELRSEVQATLTNKTFSNQHFVNEADYETTLKASVSPAIGDSLRKQMAENIKAEILGMIGGRADFVQKAPAPQVPQPQVSQPPVARTQQVQNKPRRNEATEADEAVQEEIRQDESRQQAAPKRSQPEKKPVFVPSF